MGKIFLGQLGRYGMGPRDMVANLNFFMYVPVSAEGRMDMGPGISKPGDYVDLRAEMDVLAVISNCPQMNNPVNDYNPTPVRAIIYLPWPVDLGGTAGAVRPVLDS